MSQVVEEGRRPVHLGVMVRAEQRRELRERAEREDRSVSALTRAALDAYFRRTRDTPLLFPGVRGGYRNLHEWRRDDWTPSVRAAGLEHRTPYALRHTYATFSIAAGVSLFTLARRMGTSTEQIDKTYGHLLPDAAEHERGLLDTFDAANGVTALEGR